MRLFPYLLLAAFLSVSSSAPAAEDAASTQRPYEKLPYTPSLDVAAMTKLRKMRNKVGYPDVWRDYRNSASS